MNVSTQRPRTAPPKRATRRIVAGGVAVAAAALLLSSCSSSGSGGSAGQSGSAAASTVNVAFLGYADSNNYTQWALAAMKSVQTEIGAKVTLIDGQLNPQVQLRAMETVIASHRYQAIVLMANDPVSLLPTLERAGTAHIPVIVEGFTFGSTAQQGTLQQVYPQATSTVGGNYDFYANLAAKQIESACAAKKGSTSAPCKAGLMPGLTSVPFSIGLVNQISADLKAQAPNISTNLTPQGEYTSAVSYGAAQNYLQSDKDADVIFAGGDNMVPGIQRAVQGAGLTPGKDVYLVGFGGTTEAVSAIKAGTWFASTALYPSTGGKVELQYAVDAVHGKTVPATKSFYDIPGVTMTDVNKQTLAKDPGFKGDWSALTGP